MTSVKQYILNKLEYLFNNYNSEQYTNFVKFIIDNNYSLDSDVLIAVSKIQIKYMYYLKFLFEMNYL